MIAKKNQKDLERAISDLQVRDPERRGSAAANLGVFGSADTIPLLKRTVKDESEFVRVASLYALVLLGDKEAVTTLLPFVGHARDRYRKLALTALETVTGQKNGGPHDDAEACKGAQAAWEKWWGANAAKLTWDQHKRVWVA